jgi:hypothetical protein
LHHQLCGLRPVSQQTELLLEVLEERRRLVISYAQAEISSLEIGTQ